MTKRVERHVSEAIAEKYSLEKLSARKLAEVEEHLLTCEPCRQVVAASDQYVAAMRKAAAKVRQSEQKTGRKVAGK